MEVKKDILWRVYLVFILVIVVCLFIFGKAFYIQQVQGAYWRSLSDSLHQGVEIIEAERGTIYSEDGEMLSTSVPEFDFYIDFRAKGLRENNGKRFRENLDSLSYCLSNLFKDMTPAEYKRMLQQGYKEQLGYFPLRKKVSYREYQQIMEFPLVRQGRNKSGFIPENRSVRMNPYPMLAFRTIGLARDSFKVGLELSYDTVLKGRSGRRLVRRIAGGVGVPVEDESMQIEPENGKDVVTTLDVFIQEVTENALLKMMTANEAVHGCAIVMETATGKIKAIANLGRRSDGTYWEDFNYAINPSEPGSTIKLATMMALLEDKKVGLNNQVNLEGGKWQVADRTVFDSEQHGRSNVTVEQAFELSSNVGMAKLALQHYGNTPSQFIRHLSKMRLDTVTGIDLRGERNPVIYKPGTRYWSATTLPWMAFGYNLSVSPLQTLMLYNAVANNGKLVKPYLVKSIKDQGVTVREFQPITLNDQLVSAQTLQQLKVCLEGVCHSEYGTARRLFQNAAYRAAGKTGTSLVADGNRGYADKIYQSSFAGYFPAENPQYSCIVVIRNKPQALKFYGADVAGPVFREIADRLYATYVRGVDKKANRNQVDSSFFRYAGYKQDLQLVTNKLNIRFKDSTGRADEWMQLQSVNKQVYAAKLPMQSQKMPALKGMALKDAVYACENMGLKVQVRGSGKVQQQSVLAGQPIAKGQLIQLELN